MQRGAASGGVVPQLVREYGGCAYTVLQTQRPGVYSATYDTVHYKELLNSFKIGVGHSPGFGLPSVAILP